MKKREAERIGRMHDLNRRIVPYRWELTPAGKILTGAAQFHVHRFSALEDTCDLLGASCPTLPVRWN